MIVAGFDEAGYGPRLGPLVVAWAAFDVTVSDGDGDGDGGAPRGPRRATGSRARLPAAPDLWQRLTRAVRRDARDDGRVWVADSKAVKPRRDGLKQLETAALGFLGAAPGGPGGRPGVPRTLSDLLGRVGEDAARYAPLPWYRGLDEVRLPAHRWRGEVEDAARSLRACGETTGVRFLGAGARVLDEARYNARVQATGNKADVLGETFLDLARSLREAAPGPLRIVADKHGGRNAYARLLGRAFPLCPIDVDAEGARESRYRLRTPLGPIEATFLPDAEDTSLPVALASMVCKYLRELFMDRFNAWFAERVPGLRPTAGYAQDAQRFLTDLGPSLPRLGVPLDTLVRAR